MSELFEICARVGGDRIEQRSEAKSNLHFVECWWAGTMVEALEPHTENAMYIEPTTSDNARCQILLSL